MLKSDWNICSYIKVLKLSWNSKESYKPKWNYVTILDFKCYIIKLSDYLFNFSRIILLVRYTYYFFQF